MRFRQLGSSGLFVSELCLGTATFGDWEPWAIGYDQKLATDLISRALDLGINFIDTADVYSSGQAEELTGAALKQIGVARSAFVISTKCGARSGPGPNDSGSSLRHLIDSVSGSLKRMQLDYIDYFQIHVNDPLTRLEETMRALEGLVSRGIVRYCGISNWQAWKIMKANAIAEKNAWSRLEGLQAYYSIAGRDIEREIVPLLQDQSMGLLVWGPLAAGLLSGKFDRNQRGPNGARRTMTTIPLVDEVRAFNCIDALRKLADARGTTIPRMALAWLLSKPYVTSVIIGAKTVEQLTENVGASELLLSESDVHMLDEVSALPAEYPGWYLAIQDPERQPKPYHVLDRS